MTIEMSDSFVSWWNERRLDLWKCDNPEMVVAKLLSAAKAFGFSHCAVGSRGGILMSESDVLLHSSFPRSWLTEYSRRQFFRCDPTIRPPMDISMPIVWTENMFGTAPELLELLKSERLSIGISQFVRDRGGRFGVCIFVRSEFTVSESELANLMPYLSALTHLAICRLSTLSAGRTSPKVCPDLTSREIEILRCTRDGMSAKMIARHLRISHDTVNFHIKNCVRKFGMSSKIQVVLSAVSAGLL